MKFGSPFKSMAVLCLINNFNPFVKADQPVHCLSDDVFGEWDFIVSAPGTVNLFDV